MTNTIIKEKKLNAEEVRITLSECKDTVNAILDHHKSVLDLLDDTPAAEIGWAFENLDKGIQALEDAEDQEEFDDLLERLKDHPDREDSKILELIDEDELVDELNARDGKIVSVRILSNDHREKLRAFLETEIYPYFNEQKENILF